MILYILSILLLFAFSFTEVLVYNEEVLLALCFIAFIFFAYSTVGASFSIDFQAQTEKLSLDLMNALDLKAYACFSLFVDSLRLLELKQKYELFQALSPMLFDSYCLSSKYAAKEVITNDLVFCLSEIQKSIGDALKSFNTDYFNLIMYPICTKNYKLEALA
jgi:hypothetical protein